jgi:Caspase domain/Bacterial Ig domain
MQNNQVIEGEVAPAEATRKALVVSVSDYSSSLQTLDFCRNDGQDTYQLLQSLGYEIVDEHKLIGHVPYGSMREAIIDFFTDVNNKAEDTLLFYYTGHGVPDIDGDMYLASSEIDPNAPYRKGFSFSELTKMIDRSVSIRIVTILDCCYSGAAKLSKGHEEDAAKLGTIAIGNKANSLQQGEGKCLLAASQAAQEAYALKEGHHSIFTYYLLEGLKGTERSVDAEGNVTPYSLGNFIYRSILNLPARKRPKQKPITKVEASGDIILANYPDLAKSIASHPITQSQSRSGSPSSQQQKAAPLTSSALRTSSALPYQPIGAKEYTSSMPVSKKEEHEYSRQKARGTEEKSRKKTIPSPKILLSLAGAVAVVIGAILAFNFLGSMNQNLDVVETPPIVEEKQLEQNSSIPSRPSLSTPAPLVSSDDKGKIAADNHPPIANNQSVTTEANKPIDIILTASDPEINDNLTAAIASKPLHGTLSNINQNTGSVIYTPNPGFTGTDSFTFKVNDGKIDSNNAGVLSLDIGEAQG